MDLALSMGDGLEDDVEPEFLDGQGNYNGESFEFCESNVITKEKKSWFSRSKKGLKNTRDVPDNLKMQKKFSKYSM